MLIARGRRLKAGSALSLLGKSEVAVSTEWGSKETRERSRAYSIKYIGVTGGKLGVLSKRVSLDKEAEGTRKQEINFSIMPRFNENRGEKDCDRHLFGEQNFDSRNEEYLKTTCSMVFA